nr:MAG TPA: hypothetical protein [Caudoviricetes sp.]DAP13977.1 MAG TPA: hypothetical protein [Caudoviricetes sp.]DAR64954.1 MAG TPA: hypothetical protein [Caudoviricetes sp.]
MFPHLYPCIYTIPQYIFYTFWFYSLHNVFFLISTIFLILVLIYTQSVR